MIRGEDHHTSVLGKKKLIGNAATHSMSRLSITSLS